MIDYRAKPFYLDDEAAAWVESTLASLTTDEKIGQLFCLTGMSTDPAELAVSATGETDQARRLGLVCGREGGSVGCNWAFAPGRIWLPASSTSPATAWTSGTSICCP